LKLKKVRGFGIIEILLSLSLSLIGIAGTINGYLMSSQRVLFLSCSQAANSSAFQRIEETRAAMWDNEAWPPIDELVSSNFPPQIVKLDIPTTKNNIFWATNIVTIKNLTPNLKSITVDCVWQFQGIKIFTNTLDTYITSK
jgi:Tfp pilus assembly protein PilV